ncbi:MAG TPA: hypothetical protein DCQ06_14800 [Myxococcales bacterium]|nr:hypothetical protein [Myxococcales bacterium]HAN32861.1 hypothetical protein [Myxococcales bacterium]
MSVGKRRDMRRQEIVSRLKRDKVLPKNIKAMAGEMGYQRGRKVMQPGRQVPGPRPGEKNLVRWLKAALSSILGVSTDASSSMNRMTRAALKAFQRKEGLSAHGFADERTLQVLELRTGLDAPRNVGHEAVPALIIVPLKKPWHPKKPKGEDADDPTSGQNADDPRVAEAQQAATQAAQTQATPGPIQKEAIDAAAAVAFDNEFAQLAAERLHELDPKETQKAMHRWWSEHLDAPVRPRWVDLVQDEARALQSQAASRLRRRWWSEHVGS